MLQKKKKKREILHAAIKIQNILKKKNGGVRGRCDLELETQSGAQVGVELDLLVSIGTIL